MIGTDATGLAPLGNGINGVALGAPPDRVASDGFASEDFVGGTSAAQRNIISGNGDSGVWIEGGSDNTVIGNYIGVGVDGTTPVPNGTNDASAPTQYGTAGVFIDGGSSNVIGGVDNGDGNVISANVGDGVLIDALDAVGTNASFNRIEGNLIGTDKNQQASSNLGNANGVEIRNDSTSSSYGVLPNTIGATDSDDGQTDGLVKGGNVISGNRGDGIVVGGEVSGTKIFGNEIGTDRGGTVVETNHGDGIFVTSFADQSTGPSGTLIGNNLAGSGNLISGNGSDGIYVGAATDVTIQQNLIGTDSDGANPIKNKGVGIGIYNSSNVHIGGTQTVNSTEYTLGNVISGNLLDGIDIGDGSSSVFVIGNDIGTDDGGNNPLKNGGNGVSISNSTSVMVGGTTLAATNYIGGNAGQGILIDGSNASNNHIIGNYIGMGSDGKTKIANGINGVVVQNGAGLNVIGGSADGDGNLISGNTNIGVLIQGSNTDLNAIYNNLIGVDLNGDPAPNAIGVEVSDHAVFNYIGDGADAAANVIGDNTSAGIYLTGNSGNTVVSDNQIGVMLIPDAPAIPAPNQGYGIEIVNSSQNIIGNFGTSKGNFIESTTADPEHSSLGDGVFISGAASTGNQLQYNNIGSNAGPGIEVANGASGNVIGAVTGDGANIIDGNGGAGIAINVGAHDNQVLGNDIGTDAAGNLLTKLANKSYGIDLDAVSHNTIEHNTIENNLESGLFLAGASGNSILGNSINSNGGDGVDIAFTSNSNIIGDLSDGDANVIDANTGIGVSINLNSAGNQVVGNDIGADTDGNYAKDLGNGQQGVFISNVVNNSIQKNYIRGNAAGVLIAGSDAQANSVVGNEITSNADDGVQITNGAYGNTIGGVTADDRNLISENGSNGVEILSLSHNNTIAGNWIGTDDNGQYFSGFGNALAGIGIDNSMSNIIQSNVIRGNAVGIGIIDNAAGNSLLANIITNSGGSAIKLTSGATNTMIGGPDLDDGNFLGTDDNGQFSAADANTGPGVDIKDAGGNTVRNNEIRGNSVGVVIENAASQGNIVAANDITNNVGDGVQLSNGASQNTIGGTAVTDGNLISKNAAVGVEIVGLSNNNKVIGNFIGTGDNGDFVDGDGNLQAGVGIDGSNSNTIQDNVIRGNAVGIGIIDSATGNSLLANTITNNISVGINIKSGSNNAVGGPAAADGNNISLNAGAGVYVAGGTGDAILHNNIFSNGGLGIDLAPTGVTANDDQAASTPIPAPTIFRISQTWSWPPLGAAITSPARSRAPPTQRSSSNSSTSIVPILPATARGISILRPRPSRPTPAAWLRLTLRCRPMWSQERSFPPPPPTPMETPLSFRRRSRSRPIPTATESATTLKTTPQMAATATTMAFPTVSNLTSRPSRTPWMAST